MNITELKSPITVEDLENYDYIEILTEFKDYAQALRIKDRRKRIIKQEIYSYKLSPDKTEIWRAYQEREIEPETGIHTGFGGKHWTIGYQKNNWDIPISDINNAITKKKIDVIFPVIKIVAVNKNPKQLNSYKLSPKLSSPKHHNKFVCPEKMF